MSTAGMNSNQLSWPAMPGRFSAPDVKVKKVLPPTDRENATLEAEVGETILTNLQADGIPEFFTIGGKRHYAGGTPLNVPADSFIFSRDNSMKIKDESIQKMFGKSFKKSGYSPADLSKTYDINKFREILADPDSDDLQRKTAEMMITNYNLKLGALALAQESIKGFPQGIPKVAMPYLEISGLNPAEFVQTQGQRDDSGEADMAKYGGLPKHQVYGQTGYTGLQPWQIDQSGNTAATKSPEEVKTAEPGLNTSDPNWSMDYSAKRKSPVGFSFQAEPSAGKDFLINSISGLATGINNRKLKESIESKQGAQNLFNAQAGTKGNNVFDMNFAGLNFRPNNVGAISQQQGNMQGNAGGFYTKYGGGLPKHQTVGQVSPIQAAIDAENKREHDAKVNEMMMMLQEKSKKEAKTKEWRNSINTEKLRKLYNMAQEEVTEGNISSAWYKAKNAEDTYKYFVSYATNLGYNVPALEKKFQEENTPGPYKESAYRDRKLDVQTPLILRRNKKTGEVEQVASAPTTGTATKAAPVTNTSTATAPVEKPAVKTAAPKASADPFANVTTAELNKKEEELAKKIAELKALK